jgi:hypothetical protein
MLNDNDARTPVDRPADRAARWAKWRTWFFRGIGAAAVIGTGLSFYESFSGLVGWFHRIGFAGDRAVIAPAMIDLVAVICDAVLVVMIVERWDTRHKTTFKIAIGGVAYGLLLSVVGNAGQGGWRRGWGGALDMSWNAVPPVSLALLMTVVLAVVKLWFKPAGEDEAADVPAVPGEAVAWLTRWPEHVREGTLPTFEQIKSELSCGQRKATRIRAYLADANRLLAAEQDDPGGGVEAVA